MLVAEALKHPHVASSETGFLLSRGFERALGRNEKLRKNYLGDIVPM